jgi:hypothetical protein
MTPQEITDVEIILLTKIIQEIHIAVLTTKEDIVAITNKIITIIAVIVLLNTILEEVMTVAVIILEVIMEEVIPEGVITNLQELELQEEVTNLKRILYEKNNINYAVFCDV